MTTYKVIQVISGRTGRVLSEYIPGACFGVYLPEYAYAILVEREINYYKRFLN